MRKLFFLGLLGLVFAALASAGPFGKKKEEEEERRYTGKQNAELGLKGISESRELPLNLGLKSRWILLQGCKRS